MKLAWVGIGGLLGAMARYFVYVLTSGLPKGHPSIATLGVNSLGCLLAGLVVGYLPRLHLSEHPALYVVLIGFLGSFTTFSAFALDTLQLVHIEKIGPALLNIAGNLGLSISAVFVGHTFGRYLAAR